MPLDRLSALPDSILCYILSFLETNEAAITCLLSKRWQFLWTQSPCLRFKAGGYGNTFMSRVHRTLVICRRGNLERFEVNFKYNYDEGFALDVNLWIRFAVENKVKIVSLRLCDSHVLPQMMYSNPSWTSLTLEGCAVAPRGTIQWQSLTTLRLKKLELNENAFEKIFSGCPVLSSLDVKFCWGFCFLEVNSRSIGTLTIISAEDCSDLKISAPYVGTFKVDMVTIHEKFILENIKSVVRAEIEFYEDWDLDDIVIARRSMERLFGSIGHVRMLKLGPTCIEILSAIPPDWQLLQSKRRCLELHAFDDFTSIPGILRLLKFSPNLESLDINIDGDLYVNDYPLNPGLKNDLDRDLLHLKTVCFKHLGSTQFHADELMLTLAQILLKRASVLEKMVVTFPRFTASSSTTAFYKTTQTLLSYPRSSQKAVVLFNL